MISREYKIWESRLFVSNLSKRSFLLLLSVFGPPSKLMGPPHFWDSPQTSMTIILLPQTYVPLIRVLSNLCDPFAIILRNSTNGPPHFPVLFLKTYSFYPPSTFPPIYPPSFWVPPLEVRRWFQRERVLLRSLKGASQRHRGLLQGSFDKES